VTTFDMNFCISVHQARNSGFGSICQVFYLGSWEASLTRRFPVNQRGVYRGLQLRLTNLLKQYLLWLIVG